MPRHGDAALRARLQELADQRRRFGYRRLHVLLRLEGHALNRKKAQRLYREEGLAVRRRKSRRRIAVARTPIPPSEGPNSRWSVDFVHDQLADPTIADAILDRLVHNARRLELAGDSMRKRAARRPALDPDRRD